MRDGLRVELSEGKRKKKMLSRVRAPSLKIEKKNNISELEFRLLLY